MKIKEGFLLREVAGTSIVVATGQRTKEFNGIIKLNETGVFLWKNMMKPTDMETLTNALTEEYEVSKDKAAEDVENFVKTLKSADIIE